MSTLSETPALPLTESPAVEPKIRPNRILLVVQRASRLALIAVLIWAGWYGVEGYRIMFAPVKTTEEMVEAAPQPIQISPVESLMKFEQPGGWSFFGTPWNIRLISLTTKELATALAAAPEMPEALPAEDYSDLIDSLQQLQPEVVDYPDYRVYAINQGTLRIRLITTPAPAARMIALRMAFPSDDQWVFLEGIPQADSAGNPTGTPLLPLPERAKVLCRRSTFEQETLSEFVLVEQELPEVMELWRNQGWTLELAPWASQDNLEWVCIRGKDEVQVWAHPQEGNSHRWMLFAVKSFAQEMVTQPQ